MLRPPEFQEGLQFMQAPYGLLVSGRTDHNQVFRGFQRILDSPGEVAGDREFLLIAEDPVDSFFSRGTADPPRHPKAFQAVLDLLRHRGVVFRPPVRDKGVISLFVHPFTAFVLRSFYHFKAWMYELQGRILPHGICGIYGLWLPFWESCVTILLADCLKLQSKKEFIIL